MERMTELSERMKNPPPAYELQEDESYVYLKDDKLYKIYTTEIYTGKGILKEKEGLIKSDVIDGILNGRMEIYSSEGALIKTGTYKDGQKDGLFESWKDGKKEETLTYKEDKIYEGKLKNDYMDITYKEFKKTGWEYSYNEESEEKIYIKKPYKYKKFYDNDKVIKLIGLDLHNKEISKKTQQPEVKEPITLDKWTVSKTKDSLTDNPTVILSLDAEDGYFGQYRKKPSMLLRCKDNKTELYISWDNYLGRKALVTSRIGTEKAQRKEWLLSTDSKATFYPSTPILFIRKMTKTEKIIFEITPYNEAPVRAIFDVRGLEEKIKPLTEACNWEL